MSEIIVCNFLFFSLSFLLLCATVTSLFSFSPLTLFSMEQPQFRSKIFRWKTTRQWRKQKRLLQSIVWLPWDRSVDHCGIVRGKGSGVTRLAGWRALRLQRFAWIAVCSSECWSMTVVRVLCDGFGHAVVGISWPASFRLVVFWILLLAWTSVFNCVMRPSLCSPGSPYPHVQSDHFTLLFAWPRRAQ